MRSTPDPNDPASYVGADIEDALAHDPRVAELGLRAEVAGEAVILTGSVATADRRDAVGDVVRELLPGWDVHNRVEVYAVSGASGPETFP